MAYVRNLETFADHITATHGVPRERMSVVAHSVGAVVAAVWAHDYALVLATPSFEVKLYIPGTRLLLRVKPDATI